MFHLYSTIGDHCHQYVVNIMQLSIFVPRVPVEFKKVKIHYPNWVFMSSFMLHGMHYQTVEWACPTSRREILMVNLKN